jgi:RNA polymerase sigma factor (sigma-70 family)
MTFPEGKAIGDLKNFSIPCNHPLKILSLCVRTLMNDNEIVELFFQRNPDGIQAAQEKYGAYCLAVARNILGGEEDSQECLNDLWLRAWNAIPPQRPKLLKAWLGKVIRNLAINCREKAAAQKRQGDQYTLSLSELDECIPDPGTAEERTYVRELSVALNAFLATEAALDRKIFVSRYFYCETTVQTAEKLGLTQGQVKVRLHRCRERLRKYLRSQEFDL